MTDLGDLLGIMADKLIQKSIKVCDVHLLELDQTNGITPKMEMQLATNYLSFLVLTMLGTLLAVW